jgi:hypothetical protein
VSRAELAVQLEVSPQRYITRLQDPKDRPPVIHQARNFISRRLGCSLAIYDPAATVHTPVPRLSYRSAGPGVVICLCQMLSRTLRLLLPRPTFATLAATSFAAAQQGRPQRPASVRLYILDRVKITGLGAAAFGFKEGELATIEMITPCFLIAHPRGTVIWGTGEVPGPRLQGRRLARHPSSVHVSPGRCCLSLRRLATRQGISRI